MKDLMLKNLVYCNGTLAYVIGLIDNGEEQGVTLKLITDSPTPPIVKVFPTTQSKEITGIELSPEWLKLCGITNRFPNTPDCNLYDFENYGEFTKEGANRGQGHLCLADFREKHGWFLDLHSRRTLKYIHELQNLFNANTGMQLTPTN